MVSVATADLVRPVEAGALGGGGDRGFRSNGFAAHGQERPLATGRFAGDSEYGSTGQHHKSRLDGVGAALDVGDSR